MNKRTSGLLLTLALYLKVNGLRTKTYNQCTMSSADATNALTEMMDVTEMMSCEIETDEGLLTMAAQYVLSKEAYEAYRAEEAADHGSQYE